MRITDHSAQRGQVLPVVALSLVVLMGASALAVDVGYWRYQQRIAQSAADSAAIAGTDELNYASANDWSAAARTDATSNGFTDDGGVTVSVTPNNPPTLGPYAGNANAVEVVIAEKQPGLFGRIFGVSQWVSVRSVAVQTSANRDCIYGLSPTASNTVLINGMHVNAPHCGIISDSTSSSGLTINGSTVTAESIGYAAGTAILNGSTFTEGQPAHAAAAADPCASIPGCAYLLANAPSSGTCLTPTIYNGLGTATIPAGTYCSQLIVNGTSNVVFSPGVYVFEAGITINGSNNVSGSGVTFYNKSGQLDINGSNVTLTAPASGNTAGVVVYQDPRNSTAAIVNGSSGVSGGMLYVPAANLTVNGALLGSSSLVAANTVTLNGSNVNIPTTVTAFPGFAHAVLAE